MVETFFTEKRIIKKIIIVLVFIFMFNFTFSYLGNSVVFAEEPSGSAGTTVVDKEYELNDGGGKLLLPIHALILWIADAILNLLQNSFYTPEPIIQKAKSKDMSNVDTGAIVLTVIAAAVCVAAVIYTGGTAIAGVTAVKAATAAAVKGSVVYAGITAAAPYISTAVRWRDYGCRFRNNCKS